MMTAQEMWLLCPNIQIVQLSSIDCNGFPHCWPGLLLTIFILNHISGAAFKGIAIQCTLLSKFCCYAANNVTDDEWVWFFSHCSTALTDCLLWSVLLSDNILYALSGRCSMLATLDIGWSAGSHCTYTNAGLVALAKGCSKLKYFYFPGENSITDVGVSAIARNGKLTSLRLVNLLHITDATIHVATQYCRALSEVVINNCPNISVKVLLVQLVSNKQAITSLSFSHQDQLCDNDVLYLVKHFQHLTSIALCNIPHITDTAIYALARNSLRLKRVALNGLWISDATVEAITKSNNSLNFISLSGCTKLTDASLCSIGTHCKCLMKCSIEGTSITLEGLKHLKSCKKIVFVTVCAAVGSAEYLQLILGKNGFIARK